VRSGASPKEKPLKLQACPALNSWPLTLIIKSRHGNMMQVKSAGNPVVLDWTV
jgi:hypothetical protein